MMFFQRRIFLELMGNAVTTLFLLLVVLLMIVSVKIMNSIGGLAVGEFLMILPIFLATSMDIVIPLSVLVAVVLTYGRAASDNEIDTLRSSGVNPIHLLTPGLVFGALMAIVLSMGVDHWKPLAERSVRELSRGVNMVELVQRKLSSGEPEELGDNTLISATSIGADFVLYGVTIQRYEDAGDLAFELYAEEVHWSVEAETNTLTIEPRNFRIVHGGSGEGTVGTVMRFQFGNEDGVLSSRAQTTPQLMAWAARPDEFRGGLDLLQLQSEIAQRQASPYVCIVFVLLGLPVALRFRRSDRVGAFLVAFLLALFFYFPSVKVSKALAEAGTLDPHLAAWSGHVLLVLVSGLFARKVFAT